LALLGFVQWALATPALFGDTVGMQMAMHAAHENAAWNLALGASFIAVAVKPARAVGAIPILVTFVAVLGLLSLPDLAAGLVEGARLASHAGVLVGFILVTLLSRSERLRLPPDASALPGEDTDSAPGVRGAA
jgi:predicted anti-sigma-YlaC factor YlaD